MKSLAHKLALVTIHIITQLSLHLSNKNQNWLKHRNNNKAGKQLQHEDIFKDLQNIATFG